MRQALRTIAETSTLITSGRPLLIAGDEGALRALPRGPWIGGTIPYFMTEQGGVCVRDRVFVTELPDAAREVSTHLYDAADLARVYDDTPDNGLSVLILPGGADVHRAFALEAPTYPGFGSRPLVGWIAGVHMSELVSASPKVILGSDGEMRRDKAVAMSIMLPRTLTVDIDILNLFEQGGGPDITFATSGFKVIDAFVDGTRRNLAEYYRENRIDTTLPLVADYGGASINVSIQAVDHERGEVTLYAPVFEGITYRQAKPIGDYVDEFTRRLPPHAADDLFFSCNCILNYVHLQLEGRATTGLTGPVTFGEIAYQLLNQTAVYVSLVDAP